MNNQNMNANQYNLTPEQQQQMHYQQMMSQGWNPQWNYNATQYPPPLHQQVSVPPPVNYSAPPPPPEERPPEPSHLFVQASSSQAQRGNFNTTPNRGKNQNKPNWTKGNQQQQQQQRAGGNRANFGFNQPNNNQGNAREMQQNQGNFSNNNNQQNNNRNNNQNWMQSSRNPQRNNSQQTTTQKFPPPIPTPQPAAAAVGPPSPVPPLTQEEVEFDAQFQKWEQEFDSWKKANVHHPDKNAYRQYEQQFESVRDKLLQRRAEMQKKKADQQLLANPPKTDTQLKFESQWIAGAPKVDAVKPVLEPQPSTSKASNPPPIQDPREFQVDNFEDITMSFEHESPRQSSSIPGLDFIMSQRPDPQPICNDTVISLDDDDHNNGPSDPPMASFKPLINRQIIDIKELLEEPGRSKRPEKILILIRGAPGSGKTYLAEKILEKELRSGNNRCTTLSINKFYEGKLEKSMIDKHQESMMYELRNMIKDGFFDMIIVEVEGVKLMYFNKYVHIAMTLGGFKCYVIEIHQRYDICVKHQKNGRNPTDVLEAVEDMEKFQAPAKTLMLDPTYLMKKSEKSTATEKPSGAAGNVTTDLATNLAQLLQNKNVMELLQSELNKPKPLMAQPIMPPRHFQNQNQNHSSNQMNNRMNNSYDDFQMPRNQINNRMSNSYDDAQNPRNQAQNDDQIQMTQPIFNQNNQQSFMQQNQGQGRGFIKENFNYNNVQSAPLPGPSTPIANVQNQIDTASSHSFDDIQISRNQLQNQMNNRMSLSYDDGAQNDYQLQPQPSYNQHNQQISMQNQGRGGKENIDYNYVQPPPSEPLFDNVPTFTPGKIIDYKHAHIPTFNEQLMEFRVFRVVEYKHQTTAKLQEFIRDVDVDKIIEKRKQIALRKKTLEYLRSAERPEDTVSNPTYPRGGWTILNQGDRPPQRNKRKKKKTAKIMRITSAIRDDLWMTKGYGNLDLEEISSSESGTSSSKEDIDILDDPTEVETQLVDTAAPSGTLPCFNRFRHKKCMNITKLLWEQERLSRPPRISIILRGAPGSGKSHLTQLIKKKETEMGNNGVRIVSINDFLSEDDDEPQMVETYLKQMLKLVETRMRDSICTFIIIDAENCDLMFYNLFHQAGALTGFKTYTIELYQSLEICLIQNIHGKTPTEIQAAIVKLDNNRIPSEHTLLLPLELYKEYNCVVNREVGNPIDVDESSCCKMDVEEVKLSSDDINKPPEATTSRKAEVNIFAENELTLPEFNLNQRPIVNIEEIIEEPRRKLRATRIMIILRGPSGAGKTFLAGLVRSREIAMGNLGVVVISIDDYFIDQLTKSYKYDSSKLQINLEKMIGNLKSTVQDSSSNFVIIDAENSDLNVYNKFHNIGVSYGFKCYTIELHQKADICFEKNDHDRSWNDIEKVLNEMKRFPIPVNHTLLNPSSLYTSSSKLPQPTEAARPALKSALKTNDHIFAVSEPEVRSLRTEIKVKAPVDEIQEEFLTRLKQLIMVKGEFVERNIKTPKLPEFNWHNREIVDMREILEEPGRQSRPEKIMIVLRGAPGSGKTYLANLIERKEVELGNREQFKLLSIDESFVTEETREYVNRNAMKCQRKYLKYEYDPTQIGVYMERLVDQFSAVAQAATHKFVVVDADCCDLQYYGKLYEIAAANNYAGYTIELNQDDDVCEQHNDHKRDKEIVEKSKLMQSLPTPDDHVLLNPEYLYNEYHYNLDGNYEDEDDEPMDDFDVVSEDNFESEEEVESTFGPLKKTPIKSKWDDEAEVPDAVIERLDGTRHKNSESLTMAAFLKTDDEWTMRPSFSGKKRVRWADIEEKKDQERMRDIGFIVGQTDWKKMLGTDYKTALEKTKYIEPRKK